MSADRAVDGLTIHPHPAWRAAETIARDGGGAEMMDVTFSASTFSASYAAG